MFSVMKSLIWGSIYWNNVDVLRTVFYGIFSEYRKTDC